MQALCGGGEKAEIISRSYLFLSNGNITRIFENTKEILYYYNELNELIQEDNQVLNKTVIYSYNAGGNIVSKRDILYGVPTALQPSAIEYIYDNVWKDKLISYNKNLITYDAIGNPKTYNGDTYTWEEGRRLVAIQGNNKYRYFKYNDAGIRTEKNVDGVVTKYHLVGDRVTCEYNDQDRIYYRYDNANDLVSMNVSTKNVDGSWQQGVEYYYIRNGQGDIIALIDNSRTRVANYAYDSWGRLISIKDQNGIDVTNNAAHVGYKNPYRYRGYRYDTETQLYYLNSRYYNPEWGRYLNADALGGSRGDLLSHNVFAYAKNNRVPRLKHS